jgi:hypothetical protein
VNETQEELEDMTREWLDRLECRDRKLDYNESHTKNIEAYRKDAYHFLDQEDYVRAFEAVIYAWGILETLERLTETQQ